jgi:hypothetical protein
VESPFVGVVVHGSDIAIRLDEGVLAADDFAIAFFSLVLDVSSGWVVDTVFESVFGV